jgi:hypothetical protein
MSLFALRSGGYFSLKPHKSCLAFAWGFYTELKVKEFTAR